MSITIGITDDHQLFLKSLSLLINTLDGFDVVTEASNGKELIENISSKKLRPDIVLLDVNMPVMNGRETAVYLSEHYPDIKLAALSVKDDEATIISMFKAGCCSYLLKDIHPGELNKALNEIQNKGYYNSDSINISYRRLLQYEEKEKQLQLSEKEKEFIQLACSDATYKQIALTMKVSQRTIDGYRDNVFKKLNVQSRTGMALEAIRRNIATI